MVGSIVIHAEGEFRASSLRAIGRLACGPHGARRKGNPSVEPPSDRSACLWPSWSMPEGKPERRAPERSVGSLGVHRSMGDFYPSSNMSTVGWLPAKRITLCRAGAGRTIPTSDRRPTGFAGNPHGVYLRLSEPVFGYGRIGKFSLSWSIPVASRSQEPCLSGFDVWP